MHESDSILDPELEKLLASIGPALNERGFVLVGGTALALQLNHRRSIDLDFFGEEEFDSHDLACALEAELGNQHTLRVIGQDRNTLNLVINKIKVDVLRHQYPQASPPIEHKEVQISSIQDIAAMKLNAIANRGAKKDFFDLYFLLRKFSLSDLLECYSRKYRNHDPFFVIQSLNYFEDAESALDPVLNEPVSWSEVKRFLSEAVKNLSQNS